MSTPNFCNYKQKWLSHTIRSMPPWQGHRTDLKYRYKYKWCLDLFSLIYPFEKWCVVEPANCLRHQLCEWCHCVNIFKYGFWSVVKIPELCTSFVLIRNYYNYYYGKWQHNPCLRCYAFDWKALTEMNASLLTTSHVHHLNLRSLIHYVIHTYNTCVVLERISITFQRIKYFDILVS
jgi:hypothetical protein